MLKISNFFPCFQNFMINQENLIKIGWAEGNTLMRETPDQIRRVGISAVGALGGEWQKKRGCSLVSEI